MSEGTDLTADEIPLSSGPVPSKLFTLQGAEVAWGEGQIVTRSQGLLPVFRMWAFSQIGILPNEGSIVFGDVTSDVDEVGLSPGGEIVGDLRGELNRFQRRDLSGCRSNIGPRHPQQTLGKRPIP